MRYVRSVCRIACLLAGIVFLLRGCGSKAVFYAAQWDYIPHTVELPIVSTDQIEVADDGRVFVALPYCGRIQIYDVQGHFQDALTFKSYGGKFNISLGDNSVTVITSTPFSFEKSFVIYKLSLEGHVLETQFERPLHHTVFYPTEDEFAYGNFHVRVESSQISVYNTETNHITKIALHKYKWFFAGGWLDIFIGATFALWVIVLKRPRPTSVPSDKKIASVLPVFGRRVLYIGLVHFLIVMLYMAAFALFNHRVGIQKYYLFLPDFLTKSQEVIVFLSGLVLLILLPISLFFKPRLTNLTCTISSLILTVLAIHFLIPFLEGPWGESTTTHSCYRSFRHNSKRIQEYAQNHQGKLPDATTWCDEFRACGLMEKEQYYRCSQVDVQKRIDEIPWEDNTITFAMNANVSGKNLDDLPANIVLFYESAPGWNLHGGPELLAPQNHFYTGCNVIFGDLHADFVPTKELGKLRWK